MENAVRYEHGDGSSRRVKHAVGTQNVYRYVMARAESVDMKVNASKTKVLCVSDAIRFKPEAYFEDASGNRIEGGDGLKMLGFHFSGKPNVGKHIQVLRRRFRQRIWILRHLRTAGFNDEELVEVYRTVIRPVADYMAVVYHPMLSDEQDEQLERMQAQALKSIFGWEHSYAALRSRAKIPTLRQRREDMVDKFAATCAASPVFKRWFPRRERTRQASRTSEVYVETFARCDRLRNSPVLSST